MDRVSFATTDFVTDAIVLLLPIPMVSSRAFKPAALLNEHSRFTSGAEASYDDEPKIRHPRRVWSRRRVGTLPIRLDKISDQAQSNGGIDTQAGYLCGSL